MLSSLPLLVSILFGKLGVSGRCNPISRTELLFTSDPVRLLTFTGARTSPVRTLEGASTALGENKNTCACFSAVRESARTTRLPGQVGRKRAVEQLLRAANGSLLMSGGSTFGTWMRSATFLLVFGRGQPMFIIKESNLTMSAAMLTHFSVPPDDQRLIHYYGTQRTETVYSHQTQLGNRPM